MEESIILIGGGRSVLGGINQNLWENIKHKGMGVWSINFSYLFMPFAPSAQVWADKGVWSKCKDDLLELNKKGTELICRDYAGYTHKHIIQRYEVNPFIEKSNDRVIFIGKMGLSGVFALSLAIARKYKNIYLLGYDFGGQNIRDNKTHWYQELNDEINAGAYGKAGIYWEGVDKIRHEIDDFDIIKKNCKCNIYNVSLTSNINSFTKLSYNEFYKKIKE